MDRNALSHLVELNRCVECALEVLEKLAGYPELDGEGLRNYQSRLRESLAGTSLDVFEALQRFEVQAMNEAYKERIAFEKKLRDPDDCYLDVVQREKELREQGKPSQLGYLFGVRDGGAENREK